MTFGFPRLTISECQTQRTGSKLQVSYYLECYQKHLVGHSKIQDAVIDTAGIVWPDPARLLERLLLFNHYLCFLVF